MKIICVKCGELVQSKNAKGSVKHPYCKKCFKKVGDNDYNKYKEWLCKTHM